MNKIYKLVWNPVLGQMVVASELASRGKRCGRSKTKLEVPALLVLSMALSGPAMAVDAFCVDASGNPVGTSATGSGVSPGRYT